VCRGVHNTKCEDENKEQQALKETMRGL